MFPTLESGNDRASVSSLRRQFYGSLFVLFAVLSDVVPAGAEPAQLATLDGRVFVGPFSVEGEMRPSEESFVFRDGKFYAEACLEWGFEPAPYWLRRSIAGTHFLAVLESPEHGVMRYEGVFDGQNVRAQAYWKKERWYWTIERKYSFTGRPAARPE